MKNDNINTSCISRKGDKQEAYHVIHKLPSGDSPYVRAKYAQLVEKDAEAAVVWFWKAMNAGDKVDSALKDMALIMKQQDRAEEAIEAIKSFRDRCSKQAQESLDNVLIDLYKKQKAENQEEPTRVELFIETRKSNKGKKGKRSDVEIDNMISQFEELSKDPEQNPEDVFAIAFGKEKPGRVRTYGQGVTPSSLKKQIQIEAVEKAHREEVESMKEDMKKKMEAHVTNALHAVLMNLKQI